MFQVNILESNKLSEMPVYVKLGDFESFGFRSWSV